MSLSIPLYSLLFLYILFFAIFAVFMIANIYHIVMSGTLTFASFSVTFIVLALTVLTLYATWFFLRDVDWQTSIIFFNTEWLGGFSST